MILRSTLTTRLLGVVAALALFAGACGDDETDSGGGLGDLVTAASPDGDRPDDATEGGSGEDAPARQGDDGPAPETADVEVIGAVLPMQQADPEGAIGRPAPELSGTNLDGDPISIEDDGRPKVIGFFAHWCPHCQAEIPEVVEWLRAGGLPDEVDLYGVSTAVSPPRGNFPPSAWFAAEGWTVPTLIDDDAGTAHLAYGAGNFPYWVVVGADGTVVGATSGTLDAAGLDALVAEALDAS